MSEKLRLTWKVDPGDISSTSAVAVQEIVSTAKILLGIEVLGVKKTNKRINAFRILMIVFILHLYFQCIPSDVCRTSPFA